MLLWHFRGPRVPLSPREIRQQYTATLGDLLRGGESLLRITGLLAGVSLADGRRRRLRIEEPGGLGPETLSRFLDEWSDGRPGGWVAELHGIQAVGQYLAISPRGPGGELSLGWEPEQPPAPEHGEGACLRLRLADLEQRGHMDLEVSLLGPAWSDPRAAAFNRPRLDRLLTCLGRGKVLLRQEGVLPPGEVELARLEPPLGRGVLRVLRDPGDPRCTIELQGAGPDASALLRRLCSSSGDRLTEVVARVLPEGPFSVPIAALEPLRLELDALHGKTRSRQQQ